MKKMKISKTILLVLLICATISVACSCKQQDNNSPVVEVELQSVMIAPDSSGNFELILVNKIDTNSTLKLIVANYEVRLLNVYASKTKHATPLTIDLIDDVISRFDYSIKSVLINGMVDGVYTSDILCAHNTEIFTLHSRAIDAITLAIKVKCPIYVDPNLLTR